MKSIIKAKKGAELNTGPKIFPLIPGPNFICLRSHSGLSFLFAVPPSQPTIFDETGREVKDLVGPYLEGETIVLKCITSGGRPAAAAADFLSLRIVTCVSLESTPDKSIGNENEKKATFFQFPKQIDCRKGYYLKKRRTFFRSI